LIEPFGRLDYKVTLRDSESVHYYALDLEDGGGKQGPSIVEHVGYSHEGGHKRLRALECH